jgi:hypothetical protein
MKRFTCVLTLLAAVLAVLVLPSTALAADVYHFRGKTAAMEFYSLDPTGCITTSVTVFATESRYQNPPGSPTSGSVGDVSIYQWNSCTYEDLICATGTFALPDGAFNMAGNLASASLNATGEAYDYCSGTTRPITVAVTWTGDGEVIRGNSHSSYHYPGSHVSYRSSGQTSDATGGGSLTLGGAPLPLENGFGYLSNATTGTIYNNH